MRIQSIQSKIRRFEIKQQKLHRERVIYLMMDVPQSPLSLEKAKNICQKYEFELTLPDLTDSIR